MHVQIHVYPTSTSADSFPARRLLQEDGGTWVSRSSRDPSSATLQRLFVHFSNSQSRLGPGLETRGDPPLRVVSLRDDHRIQDSSKFLVPRRRREDSSATVCTRSIRQSQCILAAATKKNSSCRQIRCKQTASSDLSFQGQIVKPLTAAVGYNRQPRT